MAACIIRYRSLLVVSLLLTYTSLSHQYPAQDEPDIYQSADDDVVDKPAMSWRNILPEDADNRLNMGLQDGDDSELEQIPPPYSGHLEAVDNWPSADPQLGQVSGIATDLSGNVLVFHRGERTWTAQSFDAKNNTYLQRGEGPIKQPTIVTLNATDGTVIHRSGENIFYMPHGITVDPSGNVWTTDVALHQVLKFEPGKLVASLTLGKAFEPAKNSEDVERFCKPTAVAVAKNGDFFVADGYCASRVLKFDKTGKLISQFGVDDFRIPHSLALAEDLDLICVADREDLRILCYNAGLTVPERLGEPEREYTDSALGRVYAIAYSVPDGVLYGLNGPTGVMMPQGFTLDLREDSRYKTDVISMWSPEDKGFDNPHALAVSADGESVYVGETRPNYVWKFVKEEQ